MEANSAWEKRSEPDYISPLTTNLMTTQVKPGKSNLQKIICGRTIPLKYQKIPMIPAESN